MTHPVVNTYRYFRSHKILFYTFLFLVLAIVLLLALRIRFEEDITGIIRKKNHQNDLEYVMNHYKFSDKLVIRIYSDEKSAADPALLTAFATEFSNSLLHRFDSTYIHSFTGNIADSSIIFYSRFFVKYLPFYLEEKDYKKLDTLTQPEAIRKAVDRDFTTLISPAGFAVRDQMLNDPLGLSYIVLEKLKFIQGGDRYKTTDGFVMTRDDRNLLLFLSPANSVNETYKNGKLLKGIDDIFGQLHNKYGDKVRGQYFGAIAMSCANATQLKKDIVLTIIIALSLIVLLIGWYFRSARIPVLSFLPALFGGGLALAVLYLVKGHVSAIALGLGSVILGLIVDYALYLINHFWKHGDMENSLREMSTPVFLCALTSAGAFLCLVFLRSSVLHDLGWFAGISVLGAAFFTLFILPHFLKRKDISTSKERKL
ncbi:MAG: MMPL family transporter, partial [Bacteroidota bacterium]|nr:MMPL family transporter [Bacteroidota bacterium]